MLRKSKQWQRALHYIDWNIENNYLIQLDRDWRENQSWNLTTLRLLKKPKKNIQIEIGEKIKVEISKINKE